MRAVELGYIYDRFEHLVEVNKMIHDGRVNIEVLASGDMTC